MSILAIDPGMRGCGCALFHPTYKTLIRAAYVRGSKDAERAQSWLDMASAVNQWVTVAQAEFMKRQRLPPDLHLAIELPRVYQGAKQKGDPNDLIDLAAVVGAIVMLLDDRGGSAKVYYPYEWKGQVPKQIHHDRARGRLNVTETATVELPSAKSLQHNVWDAVALGLTHLNRM